MIFFFFLQESVGRQIQQECGKTDTAREDDAAPHCHHPYHPPSSSSSAVVVAAASNKVVAKEATAALAQRRIIATIWMEMKASSRGDNHPLVLLQQLGNGRLPLPLP